MEDPLYPWIKSLDKIAAYVDPPSITGPTMVIASDYGGIDKRSRYRVNVFLCFDLEGSLEWEISRREVRKRYLADGRRMSYKQLSDRQRAKALVPFLAAADTIRGFCLVTVFNRSLQHLCLNSGDYEKMREAASLQGQWKDRELEEALRVTHIVAWLIGGLSQRDQNVYWISDEDNLFGSPEKCNDVARILSSFSSRYAKHRLGEMGIGTTKLDEGDRWEEDITAVTDLVSGGVAETTNRLSQACGGRIPATLAVEYSGKFIPKADLIAEWVWTPAGQLSRVVILFEQQPNGQCSLSKHDMVTG